jgi:hypothetical protein
MDVILHIGAHRSATTSFQHYMRENAETLHLRGLGFWGPRRTRNGLLTGVMPVVGRLSADEQLSRARARIAINLHKAQSAGLRHVLISDENMIGAPRRNLRLGRLYSDVGHRMARFEAAFAGRVTRIVFSIRNQESHWTSALAYAVARGHRLPWPDELDRLSRSRRNWRDVITDLACAMPDAEILITPYEVFGGLQERHLACMTGMSGLPTNHAREWMNCAPSLGQLRSILTDRGLEPGCLPERAGQWQPFNSEQSAALREAYADDLFWLRAGADGLATLIEETGPVKTGQQPSAAQTTRGRNHGIEKRRLA